MKLKNDILICECFSSNHNIIIQYVDDDDGFDEIYITYHLSPSGGFFSRLKYLFKYLFLGKLSKYGAYDEHILSADDETITKLKNVVEYLEKVKKRRDTVTN